jgi:hypothetical protein
MVSHTWLPPTNLLSVVDAFSERAVRRAHGTVKEPRIAAYPETDRFPSSAQRQSLRTTFLAGPRAAGAPPTLTRCAVGKVLSAAKRIDEPLAEPRATTPPWHFVRYDIAITVLMEYV